MHRNLIALRLSTPYFFVTNLAFLIKKHRFLGRCFGNDQFQFLAVSKSSKDTQHSLGCSTTKLVQYRLGNKQSAQ